MTTVSKSRLLENTQIRQANRKKSPWETDNLCSGSVTETKAAKSKSSEGEIQKGNKGLTLVHLTGQLEGDC